MLTITGLCHGFHTDNRTVGQNTFTENLILLEVQDTNQYGLPEVKTVKVKLSKKNMDAGLNNVWSQYKGKAVAVPVFVVPWASKAGNAGFDFYLSGDGKPQTPQLPTSKSA